MMTSDANIKPKKKVVIAGGGTSGWLAAAAFGKLLGKNLDICLIESDEIGRIGVGEATIPPLRNFHKLIGINEQELMSSIQATFKLGIEFTNWGRKGDNYFHSFGITGKDCWACDFQHFWLAGKEKGIAAEFGAYCPELQAALEGRVLGSDQSGVNYAYHLDAGLYADFLKKHAFKHGVKLVEGMIEKVAINPENGYIQSLELRDGQIIEGDLFLDCTGFRARLIEGALNTTYEQYGHYLPCDSAVAIQTELAREPRPYTQAIAHDFGWQWRIPLQHRAGNGMVYSGRHVSDDEALSTLMKNLEGRAITEPRAFKYKTGRRVKTWNKNCIAIGLAAGFLEPVESTSIHLAMSAILRLLKLFPQDEIRQIHVDEYNTQSQDEMERVRNFIILHYHATERTDTPFWRYCKNMEIPEELLHRVKLFKETAAVPLMQKELFLVDSWTQVMLGQRLMPDRYHPIVDMMSTNELERFLAGLKMNVDKQVALMPTHQQFIDSYCKAKPM
jgi:tryptophan 7-halogenase